MKKLAMLVGAALIVLLATPALAGTRVPAGYADGNTDSATGIACLSLSFPPARVETQVVAGAAAQGRRARPKRVGPGLLRASTRRNRG